MGGEADYGLDTNDSKRKLDAVQIAKQKAQEIASRLDSMKRPRLDTPPSEPHSYSYPPVPAQPAQYYGLQNKRISIPNGKVGMIIGRAGETIKNLQLQSGAKIQITKDVDADPSSLTRDVDLTGTEEQISTAEKLINDVIAEADFGGSAPSASRRFNTLQPGAEEIIMKVPNSKVALIIGKGGENIKTLQTRSGARMQVVPLHPPPGDTSTERSVHISGTKEQIEAAKELVNQVLESRLRFGPSGYVQPVYPPTATWASTVQQQQPGYGYTQPGTYPTPAPYYSNYPTQQASWDQSNSSAIAPPQQSTGYDYYGQQVQSAVNSQAPPVTSYGYDQGFTQQAAGYSQDNTSQLDQQNLYATPGYGSSGSSAQPDGSTPVQPTQPYYGQPMAGYGTTPSYTGVPPTQPGYDQTSYTQTGYGGQPAVQVPPVASQPIYGQSGYPPQPASGNYAQGTNAPQPASGNYAQGTNAPPQPASGNYAQGTNASQPASGNYAQGTNAPQPGSGNYAQGTSAPQPASGNYAQGTNAPQPASGNYAQGTNAPPQPASGNYAQGTNAPPQPASGNYAQGTNASQPGSGNYAQGTSAPQPASGNYAQGTNAPQPASGNYAQGTNASQPAPGNYAHGTNAPQPGNYVQGTNAPQPAPGNYVQGTNPPPYGQTQPVNNGVSQPVYGGGDGSSASGYGSATGSQESVPQS